MAQPAIPHSNSKYPQLCRKYENNPNTKVTIECRAVMLAINLNYPENFSRLERIFLSLKLLIRSQLVRSCFRVSQEDQTCMIYFKCQQVLAGKTQIRWHSLKQEDILYLNRICKVQIHLVDKHRFSAMVNNHK